MLDTAVISTTPAVVTERVYRSLTSPASGLRIAAESVWFCCMITLLMYTFEPLLAGSKSELRG